jgi:hypothetical protein
MDIIRKIIIAHVIVLLEKLSILSLLLLDTILIINYYYQIDIKLIKINYLILLLYFNFISKQ